MKVGEIATPLTNSGERQQRDVFDEQQRQRRQRDDARWRSANWRGSGIFSFSAPMIEADDQRADGIAAEDEARGAPAGRVPWSCAITVTSAVPKIAPTAIRAKVMICTGRSRMAEPPPPCSDRLHPGSVELLHDERAEPTARKIVDGEQSGLREQRDAQARPTGSTRRYRRARRRPIRRRRRC